MSRPSLAPKPRRGRAFYPYFERELAEIDWKTNCQHVSRLSVRKVVARFAPDEVVPYSRFVILTNEDGATQYGCCWSEKYTAWCLGKKHLEGLSLGQIP